MRVLRFRREPRFENYTARLRTYAFLFAFFSILAAKQASERRVVRAAESQASVRQAQARVGLRVSAWRSPVGVEVAILSSLSHPARVRVAVKELAGPWSPRQETVDVPPGGLRLTLTNALGERVYLLDPHGPLPPHEVVDGEPLPEESEPRVLSNAGIQPGAALEVDADGRFEWRPRRARVLALSRGFADLDGRAPPPVRAPGDPVLDEALQALRRRVDVVWRRVGPTRPLRGRVLEPEPGRIQTLVVWASLRLDGVTPRAEPLQLLLLPALPRWAGDGRAVGPGP